jgi:gliding motility-associated-like protein
LLNNWVSPDIDKLVQLYAIDEKGCVYSDDLRIRVLLSSSIFVPTVFTPNGDGANDLIGPVTDPSIIRFDYFEIYSRWGELIYSQKDFTPNQIGFGWDGTSHGKPLGPGVYVYRLKAINKRDKIYTQYGDLTLIR